MEQITLAETNEEYEAFVNKFKPKLTTDDCYTPEIVYDAVRDFAIKKYNLEGLRIVRPFWPGADYTQEDYTGACVVIDNPPFSIISEIVRYYADRNIKFFLFAPGLTVFNSAKLRDGITAVCVGRSITYENGAKVNTSFVHNLTPGIFAESDPELAEVVKRADDANTRRSKKSMPKHAYPHHLLTATMLNYMSTHGVSYRVARKDAEFIRTLDAQRAHGKAIFGGGLILSEKAAMEKAAMERAAAEKAAAEKAAAERAADIRFELSDREKEIVKMLG